MKQGGGKGSMGERVGVESVLQAEGREGRWGAV